jgi:putative ABC transport system substrate-binding protein
MKRREFITLLGSAAAAWPLAARAQQGERMRRIGVLIAGVGDEAVVQERNAAFLQGLQQLGWIVGGNLQIDFRWAGSDPERIHKYAAELLALAPEVILAPGTATVGPLLKMTSTVPIVFTTAGDPVRIGLVTSLNRPGDNATGAT